MMSSELLPKCLTCQRVTANCCGWCVKCLDRGDLRAGVALPPHRAKMMERRKVDAAKRKAAEKG